MNKREAFEYIRNQVKMMIDNAESGRQMAQEEANYHIGAMDSRYDTFKEEAQYLAGAQMRQIAEFNAEYNQADIALQGYALFEKPHTKVGLASIVVIEDDKGEKSTFFVAPALGGKSMTINGVEVKILTPQSPIGSQMMNKIVDDDFFVTLGGVEKEFYIDSIQ